MSKQKLNDAERRVVSTYTSAGWTVLRNGWPDFLAVRGDEVRGVEVKREWERVTYGGGLTAEQIAVTKALSLFFPVDVIYERNTESRMLVERGERHDGWFKWQSEKLEKLHDATDLPLTKAQLYEIGKEIFGPGSGWSVPRLDSWLSFWVKEKRLLTLESEIGTLFIQEDQDQYLKRVSEFKAREADENRRLLMAQLERIRPSDILTVDEISRRCGVGRATARKMIKDGIFRLLDSIKRRPLKYVRYCGALDNSKTV